jgi:TP901 family phage tail tape measure protein
MADQKLAVEIIFDAVDNASKQISSISSQFGELDQKARGMAQPFAEFASGLLKTEAALLAVGAALVGVAVDKAGKFGDQIAEIGTLFGGTTEQMAGFSAGVLEYGESSTQSLESVNNAVYSAISAGVKYDDALGLVAESEKLSVAGRAELGEVTKVLTGSLNAYGAATSDAGKFSDILFATVKGGQTTLPELSASLGQVTSIAATAGVPFGTLGAAISTLTASGVGTSEAITGIKSALSNIIQPTSEAEKAAAALGVNFGVAALKSEGLDGMLKQLMAATGGNVDQMAQFFGSVEALNSVMALGQDGAGKFSGAIADMANSTGATEKAFAAMAENYSLSMQKMANAADVALIKMGKPLMDEFGGVADAIAGIFKGLGTGLDAGAFDPIINLLERFGQQAADTLNAIGKNLPEALESLDFSDLVRSLEDLGTTVGDLFEKMFGEVDLSTPEGLSEALQKVVNIITGLVDVTRGIATQFGPFFDVLGGLAENAGKLGEESSVSFGKFLGAMEMLSSFGAGIATVNAIIVELGADISGIADVVIGLSKAIVNGFQVAFDTVVGTLVSFAKDFVDVMEGITPDVLGDPWKDMSKELGYVLDGVSANWEKNNGEFVAGINQIGAGLGFVGDSASDAAKGAEELKTPITEAATASKGFEPIDLGDVDFVAEAAKRLGVNLTEAKVATEALTGSADLIAPEWASAEDKARGYKIVMDELGQVSYKQVGAAAKDAGGAVTESMKEQQDQIDKAAKAAQDWALKMEEIASNERIKTIEAVISLNVAELEAQTAMVEASFDSINTTIESTGSLIGDLFGQMDGKTLGEKFDIQAQISLENKRRQDALDLQKKLVEAQVDYLTKRASALDRGDALIRVEADGLQPALEQIWYEIMRSIQVKAADEGLELLLGVMS